MGLQDFKILSISPRHVGFCFCSFLSPLVWGAFFFFFSVSIFFSAVIGCQHNLHQLEIRNQKNKNKKKLKPQQQQKVQNQNRPKTRQPNNSEVHSYLLVGNQVRSQGQKRGIVGPLAHFTTRRHAHGALHSQKHRTTALQHTM